MFAENPALFFGAFADNASLAGAPVRVIYDGEYAEALGLGGAAIRVTLPSASVPAAWDGKPLQILTGQGAGNYTVRNHQPDGTGISVLDLERAP